MMGTLVTPLAPMPDAAPLSQPKTEKLPAIELDTTLADLYRQASPAFKNKTIGQIFSQLSAVIALTSNVPRNRKYIYHDGTFAKGSADRTMAAIKYLALLPQRDAFISGASTIILFHIDATEERKEHDLAEAERTMSVLPIEQRPRLVFTHGPKDLSYKEAGVDLIAFKYTIDGMDRHETVVPLEKHWFLNSKGSLAASGLPTPNCLVVNINGFPVGMEECCAVCLGAGSEDFVIPDDCVGPRGNWVTDQSTIVYQALTTHPVPFVLKNQETYGGAGIYFIRNEDERGALVELLKKGTLRRLLSTVNASNYHLGPATLLLSEMILEPIANYGLTFFVAGEGCDDIFLGASEQMIQNSTNWIGSTINYGRQDELRHRFSGLLERIASWLRSHGYIGPAGADILETADNELHVIDLNVRTTGSICLPLLQGHFLRRGLQHASSFSISVDKSQDQFIAMFKEDLREGSLCILSWYEDLGSCHSLANVAVGGEDLEAMEVLMDRVRGVSEVLTF